MPYNEVMLTRRDHAINVHVANDIRRRIMEDQQKSAPKSRLPSIIRRAIPPTAFATKSATSSAGSFATFGMKQNSTGS